jgi:hypothetical protein
MNLLTLFSSMPDILNLIINMNLNKKVKEEFRRTSSLRLSLRLSRRQNSSIDNSKPKRKSSVSNFMSNYMSNHCTSNSVGYNQYKSRKSFSNTTNGQHSVRPSMVNYHIFSFIIEHLPIYTKFFLNVHF